MNAREWAVRLSVIGAVKKYVTDLERTAKDEAVKEFGAGDRITAIADDGTVVGTVSMTRGSPSSWQVTTPSVFREWVRKHRPTAIVTVESVRESDQRSILAQIEMDGLVPEGVTFEPGSSGNLSVRPNHDVVKTLDWRRYLELEPAPVTPVVAPDLVEVAELADMVEDACEVMHDAYERAAVGAGWETNLASRKPWADVPEANKATMRAAVGALLVWFDRQVGWEEPEAIALEGGPAPVEAQDDDGRCGIAAQWPGASHGHRCSKDERHPGNRHRCDCGAEWALKPPPPEVPLQECTDG